MATRKEFETLFKLNAQESSQFKSSFQSAQRTVTNMQRQLQALKASQSDISAYQKQQQAVTNTKTKLELLQKQYTNIQQEMRETGNTSADLKNKLLEKEAQIQKTTSALKSQEEKLTQLGNTLQASGIDTRNLTAESERLGQEYRTLKQEQEEYAHGQRELQQQYRESANSAKKFGESGTGAAEAITEAMAAAGITKLLKEIADAYAECISVAGDFEESMSNVEALSGADTADMEELSALAKELGATTKFTAKESADAMGYMAMAGWNAEQMIAGMPGVLNLAAASGEDLAQVADIVTDSMTAFGLAAEDTDRYADILAATATSANTNVSMMGETFKYAAPVAGALGYSVEDVSVAIGLMANSGIKASIAGNSLKNIFNGLLEGVTLTGNSIGELEFTTVQADGSMMDFGTTIDTLRGYFDQMTESEKTSNAIAIAGQRGYSGLLAILNASAEDYAKLSTSIDNCSGSAQRMADIKMDNMNGQLTLVQSATEAIQTTVGEQFTPTLQEAYSTLAGILTVVNEFLQENPGIMKGITTFVGVIGSATAAVSAYAAISKIATIAGTALSAAIPAVGPILAVVAAIGLVTGAVVAYKGNISEEERELQSLTATSRDQYEELQALRSEYETSKEALGATAEETSRLKYQLDDLEASYQANKQTVAELAAETQELVTSQQEIQNTYSESVGTIDDQEESTFALIQKLQDLAKANNGTVESEQKIRAVISQLNNEMPDLALSYEQVANSTDSWTDSLKRAAKEQAEAQRNSALQQSYVDNTLLKENLEKQKKELQANLNSAREQYGITYDIELKTWTAGNGGVNENLISEEIAQYNQDLEEINAALKETDVALEEVETSWQQMEEEQAEAGTSSAELCAELDSVIEKAKELGEAYQEAYDEAYAGINGSFGLFSKISLEMETSVSDMIVSLQSQSDYMATYAENLRTAAAMGLSKGLLSELSDGSQESAAYLQTIVTNGAEKIDQLNAEFAKVEKGKEDFATTVADMKTDLDTSMGELVATVENAVEDMNLQEEAANSGYETIRGFISAAEDPDLLGKVSAAYANLAQKAKDAINKNLDIHSPSRETEWSGEMVGEGLIRGVQNTTTEMEQEMKLYTDSLLEAASPQETEVVLLAPQLLEQVASLRSSFAPEVAVASSAESGGVVIHIHPEYHIAANESTESIEEQLRRNDDVLRDLVRDELEEIGIDARRVSFQ